MISHFLWHCLASAMVMFWEGRNNSNTTAMHHTWDLMEYQQRHCREIFDYIYSFVRKNCKTENMCSNPPTHETLFFESSNHSSSFSYSFSRLSSESFLLPVFPPSRNPWKVEKRSGTGWRTDDPPRSFHPWTNDAAALVITHHSSKRWKNARSFRSSLFSRGEENGATIFVSPVCADTFSFFVERRNSFRTRFQFSPRSKALVELFTRPFL